MWPPHDRDLWARRLRGVLKGRGILTSRGGYVLGIDCYKSKGAQIMLQSFAGGGLR